MTPPGVELRRAAADDRAPVLELLGTALGWVPHDATAAFFSWKHDDNPAGASPAWLAVSEDGTLLGYRTFLRWDFVSPSGERHRAVRAVDTATHPDARGRGIFRALTLHALEGLAAEGTSFVFNTPNAQSRPGYLKMGWRDLGRVPTSVTVSGLGGLVRLPEARTAAAKWSEPSSAGYPAGELLAHPSVSELVDGQPRPSGLATRRTVEHLRWRYGFGPLCYRAVTLGADPGEGLAVFRLRRRGASVEAAICEVLAPGGDPATVRRLLRSVVRLSGADHLIRLGGPLVDRAGFVRITRLGPRLTVRPLGAADHAPVDVAGFDLRLGDVELF